jgi:hypothetical protein
MPTPLHPPAWAPVGGSPGAGGYALCSERRRVGRDMLIGLLFVRRTSCARQFLEFLLGYGRGTSRAGGE